MAGGLNNLARYRAISTRDKRYDGIFYFAIENGNIFCRPSCSLKHPVRGKYSFFDTTQDATAHGYQACRQCHPGRFKNDLSSEILDSIDAGGINSQGVHGLADSLHISERHLRRIVQKKTGISPQRLNNNLRLNTAKRLITQTDIPIIDVAFSSDFSSLRQFNDVFKDAFKTSPREMRKTTRLHIVVLPLRLSYTGLLQASLIN
ncbi:MAG TPA: helix-turn-helix domain-containing protein [Patescibacteria group bacterium]|nr:helix-turn-helix domain-containing protein [Patescibacteria group bacterium]